MVVKRKKSNMKGMTIGRGMKRPTKAGAGLTKKGVAKKKGSSFVSAHKKAMKKVGR